MSILERFEAFPHGKEMATLAAVACSVVAFGISIGEFQIETHVPGFLAMILTVATTFTKVPATGLIAAAVLSFLNGFYAMLMIVTLMPHNPCKAEDFRSSHEEFCNERPGLLLYNCASTLLWGATGLLILKIPQPGDYERGQTTGALVQSLIQERVIKMGCCGQFGFFPHGFNKVTVATVVCALVAFFLNLSQFEITTHFTAVVALLVALSTTFTTVTHSVLVSGAVVCFINCFFELYVFWVLLRNSSCSNDSHRFLDEGSNADDQTDTRDYEAEFCEERPGIMELNIVSAVLWVVTGLLMAKIPQPQNAGQEQVATFNSAPDTIDGFEMA